MFGHKHVSELSLQMQDVLPAVKKVMYSMQRSLCNVHIVMIFTWKGMKEAAWCSIWESIFSMMKLQKGL